MPRELPPTAGLPLHWRDLLPARARLAESLADWLGVPEVQLECSGTASLVIALHALAKRSARREVVVPAWTCPLVALAVHRAGLVLKLCDLAPDHYDMDPTQLAALCGENTLAIVPTHIGGRLADVQTAIRIAHACGAWVIEDAAQALGAQQNGQTAGLQGDIGFFSLAVGKGLTTFEGGVLLAREPELRDALRQSHAELIRPSAPMACRRALELLGYALCYRPALLGLVYGRPLRRALAAGDPVAAVGDDFGSEIPLHPLGRWRNAVATRALVRLPDFIARTRQQAQARLAQLRSLPGVRVFDDAPGQQGVWPLLLLALPDEASRDRALQRLWTAGLGVSRMFIHALPDYDYLRGIAADARLPNAREFAARSLTISNSPWLGQRDFNRIVNELRQTLTTH
ncbi:MAG: DegT/DnrJ/EryC1/StrS family aminotransferase [Dyella sp.]